MLKNYQRLPNGVIKQIATNPFVYDPEYIEVYNKYGDARIKMAWMRMGYITGVIGNPSTLIDVGYGNGDFLRAAREFTECYGHDINDYPIPEGCRFMDDWKNFDGDVMTFFDVLEHQIAIMNRISGLKIGNTESQTNICGILMSNH